MASDASRDLLFGLLALQNGLIDQGALVAGFQAWTLDKSRLLADHLAARGDLEPEDRRMLEALVARHLQKHGGDTEKSLAALAVATSTRKDLAGVGGPDVEATLSHLAADSTKPDANRTGSYSVGSATSDGRRFRLLRPHAQGGLGAVFVARDEELHREVALKQILDHHADDPVSRQRFVIEAEITGSLEHPGIVPVYGLGTYGQGRPYYAMRFIKGDSLKDAIKRSQKDLALKNDLGRRSLALRGLLRCFVDVCNAIDYAHSKGVLHRDIKPGNVILGKHGETLVVDWGLAKWLGRAEPSWDGGERTLLPAAPSGSVQTLAGSALGTPAYMSPEQARGDLEALGPVSDVYSLGATLYTLLTGKVPFEGSDVGAILRRVQAGDFPPPRALDPSIDKALEAVCLKAMAAKAVDRYPNCRMLREDVERWTADEPVSAFREPWTLRLARWRRRHRALVTTLGLGLVAAVLALGIGAALLDRERSRTEKEYRRAREAVDQYFSAVSENDLLNVPGMQPLRGQLLGLAEKYYQQFLQERAGDPTLRADLARTQSRLGTIALALDRRKEALEAFRSTAAKYEALAASEPSVWRHRLNHAIALDRQGTLLLDQAGRLDEAEKAVTQSHALFAALAESQPEDLEVQSLLAGSDGNLAAIAESRGDSKTAVTLLRQCVERRRALLQAHPDRLDLLGDLARSELIHANSAHYAAQEQEAAKGYEQSVTLFERLVEKQPLSAKSRHDLALALLDLGRFHFERGDAKTGRGWLERGLALEEALVRLNPLVGEYRGSLAVAHNMMSDLERASGRALEAGRNAKAASDLLQALLRESPDAVGYRVSLAKASNVLGRTALVAGRRDQAVRAFARAVELYEALPNPAPVDLYNLACNEALAVPLVKPDLREAQLGRAMAAIKRAVAAGFVSTEYYRRDSDFDSLRKEPAFKQFLGELTSR